MPSLIYSMTVSLDGFIAGPDGDIGWSGPDEELHRFHNARVAELGAQLCGRRLYETMVYWDTADRESLPPEGVEFEQIWRELPKLVFSTTLDSVQGNATLAREKPADTVARLKREQGKDIAVGGAGLARGLLAEGLVDEYRLFVSPVVLGAGTPYFPPLERMIELELVETRTFGSRVTYLRYRAA